MDETTTEDHSRWCPSCSGWVREDELQVPADGKPRHGLCGTMTLHKNRVDAAGNERLTDGPRPGGVMLVGDAKKFLNPALDAEQVELLRRMAADERANGHHFAAARLERQADELEYPAQTIVGTALEPIPAAECRHSDPTPSRARGP